MKVKVSILLPSFVTLFLMAFSLQAQDDFPAQEIQESGHFNIYEDKTLIYEHRSVRDSSQSMQNFQKVLPAPVKINKPEAKAPIVPKNKAEEDDALSFNFLYYMIQKFKMSDLVDQ